MMSYVIKTYVQCYGGDVTRKRKLIERQKEGKKRLKMIGRIEVPFDVFAHMFVKTEKS